MATETKLNKRFDDCIEGFIESDGISLGKLLLFTYITRM